VDSSIRFLLSISEFEDLVGNMIDPILCHIILILKAKEEGSTEFVNHWKKEVIGFFKKFTNIKLKTKNSYEAKIKHVKSILFDELNLDNMDNLDNIKKIIYIKMYQEGYDLNDKQTWNDFKSIIEDIQINHLDIIIDLMASNDQYKIVNYVENLYKNV
jgi:hypothetical protein